MYTAFLRNLFFETGAPEIYILYLKSLRGDTAGFG